MMVGSESCGGKAGESQSECGTHGAEAKVMAKKASSMLVGSPRKIILD